MKARLKQTLLVLVVALLCGTTGLLMGLGISFVAFDSFDLFNRDQSSASVSSALDKIETTLELVEDHYVADVDRESLLTGAINGMLDALKDPYTIYMNQEETQSFNDSIESSFEGIGAEVSTEDGNIKIVAPIKGSPAEKAGIRANDVIISVNGESLEGIELYEAIKKIRGPKGTQAKLKIERAGARKPIEIVVIRDEIPIETVESKWLDHRIGYISISQFSMNTAEHFTRELDALEAKRMRGLIIDVRNNPGGLLPVVVEIMENFVPADQVLIQVKERDAEPDIYYSNGSSKDYPVTVLMNEGSASASEIMAAALRDNIDAKLVGVTTFGKGSVQNTFEEEMGDGSNIKITVAKWLTPKGETIHKKGVKPDVTVKQPAFFDVSPLSFENDLRFDMVSEDVTSAQQMLKGLGFHSGRQDGYFDRATEEAVKAFQTSKKLKVTGIIDKSTGMSIETALIEYMRNDKNDVQLKRALETIKKELD